MRTDKGRGDVAWKGKAGPAMLQVREDDKYPHRAQTVRIVQAEGENAKKIRMDEPLAAFPKARTSDPDQEEVLFVAVPLLAQSLNSQWWEGGDFA